MTKYYLWDIFLYLLVITVNNSYLAGPEERNQGFIDGGMFSMSPIYALTYFGLALCALNAAFTKKSDKLIRNILNISVNENLSMFISVGHYLDSF